MGSLGKDSILTLWAIPKKEDVPLILNTKQTIDNKLKGPSFPIHMTLAGQFDLNPSKAKTLEEEMANAIDPIEISYKGYGMKDYFFQAFYVKVNLNQGLQTTRSKICDLLKIENEEFMPHLSLYYGKQALEKKQSLLTELPDIEGSFMAETFYLVSFDPENIEWKILNSINLGERRHD
jgi:2'-5' RNA ligase